VAVTLKSDPEGARVTTRNRSFGTTPQAVKLTAGNTYELTFTKAGYLPASKRYRPPATGPQTVRVTLKKAAEPAKKPAPLPSTAAPQSPNRPRKGWFSR
jgi:hypothetical protein